MTNLHSEMRELNLFKEQPFYTINIRSIHHGRTEPLQIGSREGFSSVLPRACALFGVNMTNWDLEYNGTNLTGTTTNLGFNSSHIKEVRGIRFSNNMILDLVRRPTRCCGFTTNRPRGRFANIPRHRNV